MIDMIAVAQRLINEWNSVQHSQRENAVSKDTILIIKTLAIGVISSAFASQTLPTVIILDYAKACAYDIKSIFKEDL